MRCTVCSRRLGSGSCPEHPDSELAASTRLPPLPPPAIDGYEIGAALGAGGFAVVFAATKDDQPVALKVARNRNDHRIVREREALAAIGPPAAPALIEFGERDGHQWIAMERIAGVGLDTLIGGRAPKPLMLEVCSSVAAVHASGVVHRDLKPENIIVRENGSVVILDFGLATLGDGAAEQASPNLTRTGMQMGTALYMAPELWTDASRSDSRTDIYALGVIAFELWTGRPPFGGDPAAVRHAHVGARPPRASAFAPVPTKLDSIVARCLSKDPVDRYSSVTELASDIEQMGSELSTPQALSRRGVTGKVPMVVLGMRTSAPLAEVVGIARTHGALLAKSSRQGPIVLAFPQSEPSAAVRAAQRCAGSLRGVGGYALDVLELELRLGRRGVRVLGDGLDDLSIGDGEFVSERLRELLSRDTDAADHIAVAPAEAELIGHRLGAVVSALESKRSVLVVGRGGLGKSRVATDVARLLRGLDIRCAYRRALPPTDANPDVLIAEVMRLGLPDEAAIDGAFDKHSAAHWAARRALGFDVDDHPMLAAPGARRTALASAILGALARAPLLILDDAQWADPALLDALTRSQNDGAPALVATTPSHLESRPNLVTNDALRLDLEPLSAEDARALASQLLASIEFVSDEIVDRIAGEAAGNPSAIVELATVVLATAVRQKPGEDGLVIAGDALPSGSGLGDRLAEKLLDQIPATLIPLLHGCVVLGSPTKANIEALVQVLPVGDTAAALDPGVGLSRLCRLGALVARGDRFEFRSPLVSRALSNRIDPTRSRQLHTAALGLADNDLAIARHARGAGVESEAAAAFLRLGEAARIAHRFSEAERHYTTAIRHGAGREALAGRGRVRYRLQRFEAAVDDLQAAQQGASARERINLLLEEATCRDWCQDWTTSAALAEQAATEADALDGDVAEIVAQLRVATARTMHRNGDNQGAYEILKSVSTNDYETRMIADLLGGSATIFVGLSDAARVFLDHAVSAARAASDDFHLAAALTNRQVLEMNEQNVTAATDDLAECIELGRRLANPQLERGARLNLAEMLLWTGSFETAYIEAQRGRELQQRFFSAYSFPDDALLLARICAAQQLDEAFKHLQWVEENVDLENSPPIVSDLITFVRLVMSNERDDQRWQEVADQVQEHSQPGHVLEVLVSAAESAGRVGDTRRARSWIEKARSVGAETLWDRRIHAIPLSR